MLQKYLERSALAHPNKPAVICGKEQMNYNELESNANQVAHLLVECGAGNGANVGLYVPKSIQCVTAIFGILKAGAAYVPIDTDSPVERVAYIVQDCKLTVMIVDDLGLVRLLKCQDKLPESWIIINISSNVQNNNPCPIAWSLYNTIDINKQQKNIPYISNNDNSTLAYIIYTSGSTGNPKGVMLSHENGEVFVNWAVDYLDLNENDIFASHAPFHFDLSIFDIYASIKVGGTLCLLPKGVSYFSDAVFDFVKKNNISVWYSVPSALIRLLAHPEQAKEHFKSVRNIIYAGEVFQYQYLNKFRKILSHSNIFNFYGPTETNVITYYHVNLEEMEELTENVPIGIQCPYANIRIINKENELVKQGEIGELIVNGNSLMKGYWNDEVKTSSTIRKIAINGMDEKFYFTGDMVYQRDDGNIVYVNRRDNMVKTRGFRVELGEIETIFHKHSSVKEAAVIAIPDEEIGNRLFAYIVSENGNGNGNISVDDMEKHCSEFLPVYMIPEKMLFVDALPLTSTGKINREELKKLHI